MSILAGPVYALAVVLGAAGVLKLARPEAAVRALRTAGLPHPTPAVRALGAAEVLWAVVVVVWGGAVACAGLALAYAGFAWFSERLRRRDDAASCGCFGVEASAPVTPLHVVVNVAAALVSASAVVRPPGGVLDVLADQPFAGIPFLALCGVAAWLYVALSTLVPDLVAATRLVEADPPDPPTSAATRGTAGMVTAP